MHEHDSPVGRTSPAGQSDDELLHPEWTDRFSDYLDDELGDEEREAVERHVRECAPCAAVLDDLRRVIDAAAALPATAPSEQVWQAVSSRLREVRAEAPAATRRFSFTMPQLAAASVLLALLSGWGALRMLAPRRVPAISSINPGAATGSAAAVPVNVGDFQYADPQYDAAVNDLEQALELGRRRLDPDTVATVESDLRIIDQALDDARRALVNDPANSYLSGHVADTRQRKLDLLRRAAALVIDSQL